MIDYIDKGIFKQLNNSFILVERVCADNLIRVGLMLAVDLDSYDYSPINDSPIKATEATVKSRLPVRVEIRENAIIELLHIMLLMDDRNCDIIEPLYNNRASLKKLYDSPLNMGGGHIRGYLVENTEEIISKIYSLVDRDCLIKKYGREDKFLFAVGDGNHSLAAAKLVWDKIKKNLNDEERENHIARYCMCELVNLHCDGLLFQPIHRAVFNASMDFIDNLKKSLKGERLIEVLYNGIEYKINAPEDARDAIIDIQSFIDTYLEEHKDASIDYIHGEEHLRAVCEENNGIAIFMPKIEKNQLFGYVLNNGSLPRKAFSMGEAEDKRYYLEARVIK